MRTSWLSYVIIRDNKLVHLIGQSVPFRDLLMLLTSILLLISIVLSIKTLRVTAIST